MDARQAISGMTERKSFPRRRESRNNKNMDARQVISGMTERKSFPQSSGGNPGKTKTWMPDR